MSEDRLLQITIDNLRGDLRESAAQIITLQTQVEELRKRLIYLLNNGWRMVYMGSRYNQLKIAVSDETKEWLEQGRITIPHSAGRRVEKLENIVSLARKYIKIIPDTMSGFAAEALKLPLTTENEEANEKASLLLRELKAALDEAEGEGS